MDVDTSIVGYPLIFSIQNSFIAQDSTKCGALHLELDSAQAHVTLDQPAMTIAVTSAAITIPTTITLKAWQEIDSLIIELYTFTVTAYDCSIRFQGVTGQRTLAVLPMNTVTSS